MANPQGDKNYTRISNEILEALAVFQPVKL